VKKKSQSLIVFSLWVYIILISSGCMMIGMGMGQHMRGPMMSGSAEEAQAVNTSEDMDQLISEAMLDLSAKDLEINSLAVWRIKSQTAGLDVEMIRWKLITELVNLNRFHVVGRESLEKLLAEQGLSLSGTVDEKNAVGIGKLIGVEGFIDGYASIKNNRLTLNLSLIETTSGVIVWAKTVDGPVQP
jgi:PBP1b-binding outer membrane lipoprotein LpoB